MIIPVPTEGPAKVVADRIEEKLKSSGSDFQVERPDRLVLPGEEKRGRPVFKIHRFSQRFGQQTFLIGLERRSMFLFGNGDKSIEEMKRIAGLNNN